MAVFHAKQECFLCVLGAFAVKILFWTSMFTHNSFYVMGDVAISISTDYSLDMSVLRHPRFIKVVALCFLGGLAFFLILEFNSELWLKAHRLYEVLHNRQLLKGVIRSFGAYSPLAYMILQFLQVVIAPIPGGAIEFLGGYLFGAKAGFGYSMVGLFFGSWFAFGLARIFEKMAVEKLVTAETRKKFNYLIGHEGLILSFLLFLIPGFPKDALCYILGLTPMHTGIFLIISTLGRIPGTLMACLQGAKAFDAQYKTMVVLLGVSTLIILVFYIYHDEIHQALKKLKN